MVEASPANPQSYNFEIPNKFQITLDSEQFLLFDSGDNGNYDDRILLFSTEKSLNVLRHSDHWFSDGTFSSCPNLFGQLYTIHAVYSGEIIPLAYVLLPDKKEVTYNKMFQALKSLKFDLCPKSFTTDFEKAAMNSIKNEFPSTEIHGCFFHFSQVVWRKIQNYGLTTKYIEDVNFALQVRKLIALAFIPIDKVVNYFEVLLESDFYMENENMLTPLITYFETTWIGILDRRGRRRQPQYPIEIWNCSERLESDLPRTNNSIEGWHNAFSALINCKKPVIWKFISALQRDESLTKVIKEQLIAGYAPTKKKKYKDSSKRLIKICTNASDFTIDEVLQGIEHNSKFYK